MSTTERNHRQERDFWLYHFYQPVGMHLPKSYGPLDYTKDCVPIPTPVNNQLMAGVPCWIWRWGLSAGAYGEMGRKKAHVLSYELSRGEPAKAGLQIQHLCNRPYCIQPGHLVAGTAKQNARDRVAQHNEFGIPNTWADVEDQHDRAGTAAFYAAVLRPFTPSGFKQESFIEIRCPHIYLKGEDKGCTNCGYSYNFDFRRACQHYEERAHKLWTCRCSETFCRCHVAMALRDEYDEFPGEQTLYGCKLCRHFVFNAPYIDGYREFGHSVDCSRYVG